MSARAVSSPAGRISFREGFLLAATLLCLAGFYLLLTWWSNGGETWWHFDFVYRNNIYWGDDAYRFFLARSAWQHADLYFFSFMLPVHVLLEGVLVSAVQGDLLHARWVKVFLVLTSVALVYLSGRRLGASWPASASGAGLLALAPLYFFVGTSFYGESWLLFLVALSIFFVAAGHTRSGLLVISLLPLVRPEGIFLVILSSLHGLWIRDPWRFVLPASSGFVYLLLILSVGPGLEVFLGWRSVTGEVYRAAEDWFGGDLGRVADLLILPWVILGTVGLWAHPRHDLRIYAGFAWLLILFLVFTLSGDMAAFEPRYIAAAMPIFALGFSLGLQYLLERYSDTSLKGLANGAGVVLVGWVLLANLLSATVLKESLSEAFESEETVFSVLASLAESEHIFPTTRGMRDDFREVAEVVTEMGNQNPDVKAIFVDNIRLFYFLDPSSLPGDVAVVFPLSNWFGLLPILEGKGSVGYYPRVPYAGVYSLDYPVEGQPQVLYLDRMNAPGYPFHWRVGGQDIYLFGGKYNRALTEWVRNDLPGKSR